MVLATSGPRRVRVAPGRNVGDVERVLSIIGGGALAAAALRRRGVSGAALGALAVELVRRGASGRCHLYDRLGVSTAGTNGRPAHDFASAAATVDARRSVKVEEWITIAVPRVQVYEYWRNFENHPRFMAHVRSVEPRADGVTRYEVALPTGDRVRWDSEIVTDYSGELISWKTVGDPDVAHAGSVHFEDTVDHLGTLVTVVMDYEPPGGRAGHALSRMLRLAPEQMLRADLRRLKELLEGR